MKTLKDPRHIKRENAVKSLFSWEFNHNARIKNKLAKKIVNSLEKIDKLISENAPEWPIKKINKIDLAILRLAIFELIIDQKQPPRAIIDEAVELGKQYGSEQTPKFINGVLGAIFKKGKNEKK
jgi:N utilization substance protein B